VALRPGQRCSYAYPYSDSERDPHSIDYTFYDPIRDTFCDTLCHSYTSVHVNAYTSAHVNADAGTHSDTRSDTITGSDRYPRLPLLCGTSDGIRERRREPFDPG